MIDHSKIVEKIEHLVSEVRDGKGQIVLISVDGSAETIGAQIRVLDHAIEVSTENKNIIVPFVEIQDILKREICDFDGCYQPAATPKMRGVQACNNHIDWWDTEIERPERDE